MPFHDGLVRETEENTSLHSALTLSHMMTLISFLLFSIQIIRCYGVRGREYTVQTHNQYAVNNGEQ